MGLVIRYEVNGAKPVEHEILRFGERATLPEPALWGVVDVLRGIEKKRFEAEGPGWAANAPSTVAQKTGPGIGRETEALFDSLTKEGAEGSLAEVHANTLHFGTNLTTEEGFPYPVAFDKGRTDGSQPPRPIFDLKAKDLAAMTKVVQAWLVGEQIGAGFNMGGDRIAGSDVMPSFGSQIFADF